MADMCEEPLENLAARLPCAGPPFSDRPAAEVPMPKLVGGKSGGKQPAASSQAWTAQKEEKRAAWLLEEPTWRWWNSDLQTYSIEIRAQRRLELARSSSCGSTCGASTMSPTSPPAAPHETDAPMPAPAPEPAKPQKRRDEAWSWWDEDLEAYTWRPVAAQHAPGDAHGAEAEAPSPTGAISSPPAEAPSLPGAMCAVASPSVVALPGAAPHATESAVLQALLPPASMAPHGASPMSCATSPEGLEAEAESEDEGMEEPDACWARFHLLQRTCQQHISSMAAACQAEDDPAQSAEERGAEALLQPNPESPTRHSVAEAASQTDSPSPMFQVVAQAVPPACTAQAWMPTALVSPCHVAALTWQEAIGCPALSLPMQVFGTLPPSVAPAAVHSSSPETREVQDAVQVLQRGAAEMSETRARIEETLEALTVRRRPGEPRPEEMRSEAPSPPQLPQLWDGGARRVQDSPPEARGENELSRKLAAMQSTVTNLQETHDRLTPLDLTDLGRFGSPAPPRTATFDADVGGVPPFAGGGAPQEFIEGAFPETPLDELGRQGFAGFALMSHTCGSASPSSASPGSLGIRVVAESGIPKKAVLSLKVGDVRRQAQISELRRQAVRFRAGPGPAEVAMRVFRTMAAGSFVLHPDKAEYTVALHGEDGRALGAKLLVSGHRPTVSSATADPYFQKHQVLPYVAALFQAAILDRAADPFAFMEARVRELLYPRAPKPRGQVDDGSVSPSAGGVELRLMPYELLPQGCVVSVRLGSERKHVRASCFREKGVRFSAWALAPLNISILAPEATQEVKVIESYSDRRMVRLSMESMSLDVVILRKPDEGDTEAQENESQSQPENALDDESYSRNHGLKRAAYDLFRKLGDTKPEEPLQFVLRYLQEFRIPAAQG